MQSLASKLVRIMEECNSVQKNGLNEFHKYKYATSADVLEKVNASLVKHNIASIVLPEIISSCDVINNKGNTEHLVTVKAGITLIDADSGECISLVGIGSGQDGGDKAVMKAQTAAIKYAYLLSLAISTNSDDPEADRATDEGSSLSEDRDEVSRDILVCQKCGSRITPGIKSVSQKKYGSVLCMKCQKQVQGVA